MFTYIYSLLIQKYICDFRNVSMRLSCVFVCLSSGDLFNLSVTVSSFLSYFSVIRILVLFLSTWFLSWYYTFFSPFVYVYLLFFPVLESTSLPLIPFFLPKNKLHISSGKLLDWQTLSPANIVRLGQFKYINLSVFIKPWIFPSWLLEYALGIWGSL